MQNKFTKSEYTKVLKELELFFDPSNFEVCPENLHGDCVGFGTRHNYKIDGAMLYEIENDAIIKIALLFPLSNENLEPMPSIREIEKTYKTFVEACVDAFSFEYIDGPFYLPNDIISPRDDISQYLFNRKRMNCVLNGEGDACCLYEEKQKYLWVISLSLKDVPIIDTKDEGQTEKVLMIQLIRNVLPKNKKGKKKRSEN